jgi:hypothetical protein
VHSGPATAAAVTSSAQAGLSRARRRRMASRTPRGSRPAAEHAGDQPDHLGLGQRRRMASRTPRGIPAGTPRPGPPGPPAWGRQQPGDLLDEERVAAGPPAQVGDQGRFRPAAEHAGDQPGHLGLGQRRQGDDGGPGRQVGQQGRGRVVGRGVEVAVGGEHQRPGGRQPAGQEVEQLQRRRVGPLEVLQDHHQRPVLGGGQQHRGDLVQQPEPGRGRLVGGGRRGGPPGSSGRSRASEGASAASRWRRRSRASRDRSTWTQGQ